MLVQAKSLKDFMDIRRVRNECRFQMTNNQRHITVWDQFKFYIKYKFDKNMTLYLWRGKLWPCIGYGVIRWNDGKAWITGGVDRGFRGLGFGEGIFSALIDNLYEDAYLDVLYNNEAAIALYKKLGFKKIGERQTEYGKALIMRREYSK